MNRATGDLFAWSVLSFVLVALTILLRPIMPIDETRYLAVAWEMYLHGDLLVPHLNGMPYSHKPPMMFWLFNLGWWLFGVNDLWPRLLMSGLSVINLVLTWRIALRLWPDRGRDAIASGWILLGMPIWGIYATGCLYFEMLLTLFVLITLVGVLRVALDGRRDGWLIAGAGIGLGILSKGPVVLVYTLPVMLIGPWWLKEFQGDKRWLHWYLGILAALILGLLIAVAWALPASLRGGEAYTQAILWGQTAGRMVHSFAHRHAFWWYVTLFPLLLYPWFWWGALWRSWGTLRQFINDTGNRFLLAWLIPSFVIFSLISGKQPYYLVPLLPAFALLSGHLIMTDNRYSRYPRLPGLVLVAMWSGFMLWRWFPELGHSPEWMDNIPLWGDIAILSLGLCLTFLPGRDPEGTVKYLATGVVTFLILVQITVIPAFAPWNDMRGIGQYLSRLQQHDVPIAYLGKYRGEFHFAGRLRAPLKVIYKNEVMAWLAQHPQGRLVSVSSYTQPKWKLEQEYQQRFRGKMVSVYHARTPGNNNK